MEYAFIDPVFMTVIKIVTFPEQFTGVDFPELVGLQYNNPPFFFTENTVGNIEYFDKDILSNHGIKEVERPVLNSYEAYGNPYYDAESNKVIIPKIYNIDVETAKSIRIKELDYKMYDMLGPKTDKYGGDWLEIKVLRGAELDTSETLQILNRESLRNKYEEIKSEVLSLENVEFVLDYKFILD